MVGVVNASSNHSRRRRRTHNTVRVACTATEVCGSAGISRAVGAHQSIRRSRPRMRLREWLRLAGPVARVVFVEMVGHRPDAEIRIHGNQRNRVVGRTFCWPKAGERRKEYGNTESSDKQGWNPSATIKSGSVEQPSV